MSANSNTIDRPKPNGKPGSTKYPWEHWFRKAESQDLLLRQGKDFVVSRLSLAQQLRNKAAKKGWYIRISEAATGLIISTRRRPTWAVSPSF